VLVGAALLAALPIVATCSDTRERLQEALKPVEEVDQKWRSDSTTIARGPDVLYRILPSPDGPKAIPVFTLGEAGLKRLRFGARGWRAFDVAAMSGGDSLYGVRNGRSAGAIPIERGMWERAPTLDSIPGCPVPVPAALLRSASVAGLRFATTRPRPAPMHGGSADNATVQRAVSATANFIAPRLGVSPSNLSRYSREVHVVPSAAGAAPTIVVVYDDPQSLPDSVAPMAERPRHLVIVMDEGTFGYKASFTYTSHGNRLTPPRLRFLDYLDTDEDGLVELFFGLTLPEYPLYTVVLRRYDDGWRELLRSPRERCDVI
jgi:hypothetical protein